MARLAVLALLLSVAASVMAGNYECKCLNSSGKEDKSATKAACTTYLKLKMSGDQCYPVTEPAKFIYTCWQDAGSHGGLCN